jgi:hypothetical protein
MRKFRRESENMLRNRVWRAFDSALIGMPAGCFRSDADGTRAEPQIDQSRATLDRLL